MSSTPDFGMSQGTSRMAGIDRPRAIRPVGGPRPQMTVAGTYTSYIGRVGALAVALGIGAAVVAFPVSAFADSSGSAGSSGSSSSAGGSDSSGGC